VDSSSNKTSRADTKKRDKQLLSFLYSPEQLEVEKCKSYALNSLSFCRRSSIDLEERMLKRGFCVEVVNEVIETYKDVYLLDDESFASSIVADCCNRNLSRFAITKVLERKKIPTEIITKSIACISDETEHEMVVRFIDSKVKRSINLPRDKMLQRVYGQVARKLGHVSNIFELIKDSANRLENSQQ
jgi:SOS response regulatory protein OraA/RecX